jgi:shikimate kinase
MESLPPGTCSVWLKVTPEEAVRRVGDEGPTRPLLAVEDPLDRARRILAQREVYYEKADLILDSLEGDPGDLARRIEEMMAESGRERLPSTSA